MYDLSYGDIRFSTYRMSGIDKIIMIAIHAKGDALSEQRKKDFLHFAKNVCGLDKITLECEYSALLNIVNGAEKDTRNSPAEQFVALPFFSKDPYRVRGFKHDLWYTITENDSSEADTSYSSGVFLDIAYPVSFFYEGD